MFQVTLAGTSLSPLDFTVYFRGPQVVADASLPAAIANRRSSIALNFGGPISPVAGSSIEIWRYENSGATSGAVELFTTVPINQVQFVDDYVVVNPAFNQANPRPFTSGFTYFVRIGAGSLTNLAGVANAFIDTHGSFEFLVDASDSTAPVFLGVAVFEYLGVSHEYNTAEVYSEALNTGLVGGQFHQGTNPSQFAGDQYTPAAFFDLAGNAGAIVAKLVAIRPVLTGFADVRARSDNNVVDASMQILTTKEDYVNQDGLVSYWADGHTADLGSNMIDSLYG